MSEYSHREIEKKWQAYWQEKGTFHVSNASELPKYYVGYVSLSFGCGAARGNCAGVHRLGYLPAKRLKGFNVLHPMGFDSFRVYQARAIRDPNWPQHPTCYHRAEYWPAISNSLKTWFELLIGFWK